MPDPEPLAPIPKPPKSLSTLATSAVDKLKAATASNAMEQLTGRQSALDRIRDEMGRTEWATRALDAASSVNRLKSDLGLNAKQQLADFQTPVELVKKELTRYDTEYRAQDPRHAVSTDIFKPTFDMAAHMRRDMAIVGDQRKAQHEQLELARRSVATLEETLAIARAAATTAQADAVAAKAAEKIAERRAEKSERLNVLSIVVGVVGLLLAAWAFIGPRFE